MSIASMACTSRTLAASCSFLARASLSWVPVPWRVAHTVGEAALAPRCPSPLRLGAAHLATLAREDQGWHAHTWRHLDTRVLGPGAGTGVAGPLLVHNNCNHPHCRDETPEAQKRQATSCESSSSGPSSLPAGPPAHSPGARTAADTSSLPHVP